MQDGPSSSLTLPTLSVEITEDGLFDRSVYFAQPRFGYRAAIDGLLLVRFTGLCDGLAIDLGAGAGQITLALLARRYCESVLAVEPDDALVSILAHNLQKNSWANYVRIVPTTARVAAQSFRGSARVVLCNPPYYRTDTVTLAHDKQRRQCRTADRPLVEFLGAARNLLGRAGRACIVWPARDLVELLSTAQSKGLAARRMLFVHHRADRPASRVLVELRPGKSGNLTIEPPYILESIGESGVSTPSALLSAVTARANQR